MSNIKSQKGCHHSELKAAFLRMLYLSEPAKILCICIILKNISCNHTFQSSKRSQNIPNVNAKTQTKPWRLDRVQEERTSDEEDRMTEMRQEHLCSGTVSVGLSPLPRSLHFAFCGMRGVMDIRECTQTCFQIFFLSKLLLVKS